MVCEGLVVLSVQSASGGEHDSGVQVSDDSSHGTGGSDAGLGAAVARLQGRQDVGDLEHRVDPSGHAHTDTDTDTYTHSQTHLASSKINIHFTVQREIILGNPPDRTYRM